MVETSVESPRELVERILRVQNLWDGVVDSYLNEPADAGSVTR